MAEISIAELRGEHWEAVRAIYLEGIATGNATFQETAPEWAAWDESHLQAGRIVVLDGDGAVAGWAALSPVSQRAVYAGVAEVSVYVAEAARGRGLGRLLITELIARSEAAGIWTLQAGIFPENLPSLAMHCAAGFREVGVRSKLGCLRGVWRDVLLMERRSATVGLAGLGRS